MVVHVIRRGNDDRIGELRHTEDLCPVAELMLGRNTIGLRHLLPAHGIDIRHTDNLERCRVLPAIRGVHRSTCSGSDDDGGHRLQHDGFLIRETEGETFGVLR